MTPKFEIFCQNFTLWDGNFGQFAGKKSYFLAFFKIILELFRKCLGIVFVLKRPSFWCIYTSKCWLIAVIRVFFDNKCCKSKSKKCPTRYFRNFVCFFLILCFVQLIFFKCVFDRERKVRQKLQKVCRNRKLEPKKKKNWPWSSPLGSRGYPTLQCEKFAEFWLFGNERLFCLWCMP